MTTHHSGSGDTVTMPTDVNTRLSFFDRFATKAAAFVSGAWFFAMCVLLVLIWAPSYFAFGDVDTWQLIINTATTIVTFLLVALLQNTQRRADEALQHKLNAIADALADLMKQVAADRQLKQLHEDMRELRAAIGLENKEGT
ncbi:low affinity iron permease family protein [Streptosporangium sp. NPDC001559]|uniref:low affinity iron permease family protein n=1 Tax=Streptosporangium sp. NPDC001559 TaxID=3366187 RepID=UPI0036EF5B74